MPAYRLELILATAKSLKRWHFSVSMTSKHCLGALGRWSLPCIEPTGPQRCGRTTGWSANWTRDPSFPASAARPSAVRSRTAPPSSQRSDAQIDRRHRGGRKLNVFMTRLSVEWRTPRLIDASHQQKISR